MVNQNDKQARDPTKQNNIYEDDRSIYFCWSDFNENFICDIVTKDISNSM